MCCCSTDPRNWVFLTGRKTLSHFPLPLSKRPGSFLAASAHCSSFFLFAHCKHLHNSEIKHFTTLPLWWEAFFCPIPTRNVWYIPPSLSLQPIASPTVVSGLTEVLRFLTEAASLILHSVVKHITFKINCFFPQPCFG